ncbi:uncharacterized protein BXZ73DRAFT_107643 [Epithele typhae]|uniref:uncharacterized protein n=1 Tax=Epithele typhae TaxID=378194 RepID=UPI002008A97F|nr:uncharacterized protein BXZ73DRAFT_107643 [Epithele typhae]KAH9912097.1 hypothetical protein BXZ73DRAFT_107643 [Epithele typhae]
MVKILIKVVDKVEEVRSNKKGLQDLAKDLDVLAGILHSAYEHIRERVNADCLVAITQAMDQLIEGMRQQRCDDAFENYRAPMLDIVRQPTTPKASSFQALGKSCSSNSPSGKVYHRREFAKCQDDDHGLAASFFFARDVADCSNTRLFFPTVAYQVARSQADIETFIVDAIHTHLAHGRSQQMQYEAEALLTTPLLLVDPSHRPIVFVVDALDECIEPVDRDLPGSLVKHLVDCAQKARFPVKILFTGRPLDAVDKAIHASIDSPQDKIYSLDINNSVLEDVKLLLRDRLANNVPGYDTLRNRGDLVDRLAERSEGLMIYADTAVKFLAEYPEDVDERAEYLLSDPERCVVLGPLNDLYLKVLEIVFPRDNLENEKPLRDRVQTMLGTIALLRDRFSPNDLYKLLSTPTETSVSVLRHLRSVVFFDRSDLDAVFRPIHITFSQFLVDVHPKYNKGPYLVSAVREHGRIAMGCLNTLVSSLRQNPLV